MIEICDFSINEKITLLEAIKALDCPPTDSEKNHLYKGKKELRIFVLFFSKKATYF